MRHVAKGQLYLVIAAILFAVAPAVGAPPLCSSPPSSAPERIPTDFCGDRGQGLATFAPMAWQTFKMLVWPAATSAGGASVRGVADTSRPLSDMTGPRVFETFKSDWETFLDQAVQPQPWNEYPSTAFVCANQPPLQISPGTLVLGSLNEFGNVTEPSFAGVTFVLIGQNGKLVRYLAAYDQNVFDLIRTNGLYKDPPSPSTSQPAAGATAPDGAMTVKSAWIEMEGLSADPATFYTRKALLQDPATHLCKETTVGLVGLHIVHKTKLNPQWIWASFEHVKNAPLRGDPAAPGFTFNDGTGKQMLETPPKEAQNPMKPGWTIPKPYNVERLKPIAPDAASVNADWRAALAGTVWANYELVLAQWPGVGPDPGRSGLEAKPNPPCFEADQSNLANTTMETFLQSSASCTSSTTCMGCHNQARSSDFVWGIPLNKMRSAAHEASHSRLLALEYLMSIVERQSSK
jgi:hypothetical protein